MEIQVSMLSTLTCTATGIREEDTQSGVIAIEILSDNSNN